MFKTMAAGTQPTYIKRLQIVVMMCLRRLVAWFVRLTLRAALGKHGAILSFAAMGM